MGDHKYTIAVPVRDGGEYVKECVRSILAQSQPDFDLVVLDNASTDGTTRWLATLDDPRIRIVSSDHALSVEESWNRIVHIPKNPFLVLIGHDDFLHPDFLETIDRLMRKHPDAALYLTHFRLIDEEGRLIRISQPMPEREMGWEYLDGRLLRQRDCHGPGWVLRSADYDKVGGLPNFRKLLFADDAFVVGLTLEACKAVAPEICFSARFRRSSVSGGVMHSDLVQAAGDYVEFLAPLRSRSEKIDAVLRQHGAGYIMPVLRGAYRDEFLLRLAAGEPVPEAFLARLGALARFFAPQSTFRYQVPMPYRLLQTLPRGILQRIAGRAVYKLFGWARIMYHHLKSSRGGLL